jgi:hypothetical protein
MRQKVERMWKKVKNRETDEKLDYNLSERGKKQKNAEGN